MPKGAKKTNKKLDKRYKRAPTRKNEIKDNR